MPNLYLPWKAVPTRAGRGAGPTAIVGTDGTEFARTAYPCVRDLILAAPDLLLHAKLTLAALQVAIDNCTWKEGLHLVAAEQAAEQMRQAIARARGE